MASFSATRKGVQGDFKVRQSSSELGAVTHGHAAFSYHMSLNTSLLTLRFGILLPFTIST